MCSEYLLNIYTYTCITEVANNYFYYELINNKLLTTTTTTNCLVYKIPESHIMHFRCPYSFFSITLSSHEPPSGVTSRAVRQSASLADISVTPAAHGLRLGVLFRRAHLTLLFPAAAVAATAAAAVAPVAAIEIAAAATATSERSSSYRSTLARGPPASLCTARTSAAEANERRGGQRVWDPPSTFDEQRDECLPQLLQEEPALVALAGHPVGVELPPHDEGAVRRDVEDVVEEGQGPARGHPPVAVGGDDLVQVVDSSLVGVVVEHA